MSRKFMALHVVLLLLAGVLIWQLRVRWLDAKAKENEMIARRIGAKKTLAPPVAPPPAPASPAEFLDVAQRTLFSKDRNPNVVVAPVEAPKPEPEPPMPALPHYHGQMAIGEPVALLSIANGVQKGYHVGDAVGDYKLTGFNRETIDFEWHGKKVEKKLEELVSKEAAPAASAPSQGTQTGATAARNGAPEVHATPTITTVIAPLANSGATTVSTSGNSSQIGPDLGGGVHGCVPGDESPAGTVVTGLRKNVLKTMFGEICRWEPAK